MAKITGFLVQALLVGLSFWLNASHNANALRDGIPGILPATVAAPAPQEANPEAERSDYDYQSNHEAGRALNSGANKSHPADEGASESPSNERTQESRRDDVVTNSTNAVKLAREEDTEIDESVRPKGGKLVSIPSVEVDALRGRRGADDRIIGVSKAELLGTSSTRAL